MLTSLDIVVCAHYFFSLQLPDVTALRHGRGDGPGKAVGDNFGKCVIQDVMDICTNACERNVANNEKVNNKAE